MLLTGQMGLVADDVDVIEFGYGLGPPTGILVLRYPGGRDRHFPEWRDDFVHQFYWSPDGHLVLRRGSQARFVGPGEVLWAHRGAVHAVSAVSRRSVYRVCLRQVPPALDGVVAGACSISAEAARLVEWLGRPGVREDEALAARQVIMDGLRGAPEELPGRSLGSGLAARVAREIARDPADDTRLEEWAGRLHTSVKTLQRDFTREFGTSFTTWRTKTRLRAAVALLETSPVGEVAHRVGYSTVSAFVTAFTKEHGCTPGRHVGTLRAHSRPVCSLEAAPTGRGTGRE